jgi:hypothetical protein
MNRLHLAALVAVACLSCAGGEGSDSVPVPDPAEGQPIAANVGTPLTLSVGQIGSYPELELTLSATVIEDSRCPTGVECVWAGDGAVTVEATKGASTETLVLHTHDTMDQSRTCHGGITVKLLDLSPYPAEGKPIPGDAYVVSLGVERAPD